MSIVKRITLHIIICTICLWSTPNFDTIAEIFGKEIDINEKGVSGYLDREGRLWILGRGFRSAPTMKSGVKGEITVQEEIPYLHFWLYDKDGKKMNEGSLGDSVGAMALIPLEDDGALVIWRCLTHLKTLRDPPSGYIRAELIDEHGVIKDKQIITKRNLFFKVKGFIPPNKISIELWHYLASDAKIIQIEDEKIKLRNDTLPPPSVTPDRRTFNLLETFDSTKYFGWARVDTASKFGRDVGDRITWADYILIKDQIQIATYDAVQDKWNSERYNIPKSCFRKYDRFDLFPLHSTPTVQDYPEVQSVRLNNSNIIVTVFMKEDNKPVAYQMLFDALGQCIMSEKTEVLQPKDIDEISDRSTTYIKRALLSYEAGKYKSANVYIWGYDVNGMLYWKKYTID